MGNSTSAFRDPKIGLVALAKTMPLSQHQLVDLKHECILLACGHRFQSFTIDRESFGVALLDTMVEDSDTDILDALFTMWDMMGSDSIQYREFLVGVSPLASGSRDSLRSVLHYSLALMDTSQSGIITPYNLTKVLRAINSTASFLGDTVLRNVELQEIVSDVFGTSLSQTMSHDDVVPRLVMHPKVHKFIEGKGGSKYKLPEQNVVDAYEAKRAKETQTSRDGALRRLYEC
jgi:Ca2+-binding EF-hand superfamily protein